MPSLKQKLFISESHLIWLDDTIFEVSILVLNTFGRIHIILENESIAMFKEHLGKEFSNTFKTHEVPPKLFQPFLNGYVIKIFYSVREMTFT